MDAERDYGPAVRVPAIDGDQDRHGVYQVGRLPPQDCPLPERFRNKVDLEVRQVPQAAVDQPR